MTGGRPSPYKAQEVAKGIEQHIKDCKWHSYLPTVEGLAIHLNVNRSTIYEWRQKHEEFSDIIERMLALQASQLIQNGLVGHYNSTITQTPPHEASRRGRPAVQGQGRRHDGRQAAYGDQVTFDD
jgi:hypothetical protein